MSRWYRVKVSLTDGRVVSRVTSGGTRRSAERYGRTWMAKEIKPAIDMVRAVTVSVTYVGRDRPDDAGKLVWS